jgi:hypothetical protein
MAAQPRAPYPPDTPITQMGLDAKEVDLLTDGAKKLDKAQLLTLQQVTNDYRSEGETKVVEVFDQQTGLDLTIADLTSIAEAFDDMTTRVHASPELAAEAACCCCTCCPCCSCTASVVIEAVR